MRVLYLTTIFLILYCLNSNSYAQKLNPKKATKLCEKGKEAILNRDFETALENYNKAIEADSTFAEGHFRIAKDIFLIYNYKNEMLYHFEKAISLAPTERRYAIAYMYVIENKMSSGDYEAVKEFSNNYKTLDVSSEKQSLYVNKVLADCEFAEEGMQNPLPFSPTPLPSPLNEMHLQYFPALTADEKTIIFTARLEPNSQDKNPDENIYISNFENGEWTVPQSISQNINTPFNEGTSSISADGKVLVFTACASPDNPYLNCYGRCDLYVSYREGDNWSTPENLGRGVNSKAWESQPTLSADGNTLYFISERNGGLGRRDIWVSKRQEDGSWGQAQNLGSPINTEWDEVSPFIHVNGKTLYFSSQGHVGFGGYDLYMSNFEEGNWQTPQNLGYPLNTYEDQVGLFITADGTKGYYSVEEVEDFTYLSSVLHIFEVPEEAQPNIVSHYVTGKVYDANTGETLQATVELYDLATGSLEGKVGTDPVNGSYTIILNEGSRYAVQVNKLNYAFKSLSFDFEKTENQTELVIDIPLEPITQGTVFTLNNIFFDANEYALKPESKIELDKLIKFMQENSQVRGEISGHTDDRGSESDNQTLSLNRAKSVYNYLIENGIDANRLTFQGYGETKPAASNDTEENRAKNRRIEFKIL